MGRKIKIAYIINSLTIGGSEKVLIESINNLDASQFEPHIISLSPFKKENSIFSIIPLKKDVEITYLDFLFNEDYSLPGYFKLTLFKKEILKNAAPVLAHLSLLSPGIIHFHTSPRELVIGQVYKNTNPACLVFTDHSLRLDTYSGIKKYLLSLSFKRLYKGFNTISVSRRILKNLDNLNIIDASRKNTAIPNSIDLAKYHKTGKSGNFLTVTYVSRISLGKGHKVLIDAWALLNDIKNIKLIIVGPDDLNGEMQAYAQKADCENNIEFTGAVKDPSVILAGTDIGVFPSFKEGLPLSLLEKMASAIPVIASDIPELRDIVEDNETGLLFKRGNCFELSDKLRLLLNDKALRIDLGNAARTFIEANYNAEKNKDRLASFYMEALGLQVPNKEKSC